MNETVIYKNLIEFIQQNLEGRLIILVLLLVIRASGSGSASCSLSWARDSLSGSSLSLSLSESLSDSLSIWKWRYQMWWIKWRLSGDFFLRLSTEIFFHLRGHENVTPIFFTDTWNFQKKNHDPPCSMEKKIMTPLLDEKKNHDPPHQNCNPPCR